VVVDPKGEYEVPGDPDAWELVDHLPRNWEHLIRRERNPKYLRLLIRPVFLEDQTLNEDLNELYRRIFDAERCLLYLDEIQALVKPTRANPALSRLVQQGRAKKISVWGSTLRPSQIPRMFISESDHVFGFRLRDAADRKRIKEVIGERGEELPGPGPHDFWYRPPGVDITEPILVHQ
jgi:DNA helicase HerA-like ATPase